MLFFNIKNDANLYLITFSSNKFSKVEICGVHGSGPQPIFNLAGQGRLREFNQFAALERAMRDWELVDSDRFSFEDSDRFEEDSLCSWISEPESLCNNWRGWKRSNFASNPNPILNGGTGGAIGNATSSSRPPPPPPLPPSSQNGCNANGSKKFADAPAPTHPNLVEMAAKCVASHIPFEMVERFYPPVPEQLQLRIAFWSFPEHEEDIRLYSCLGNFFQSDQFVVTKSNFTKTLLFYS
jgi:hypothetical protein